MRKQTSEMYFKLHLSRRSPPTTRLTFCAPGAGASLPGPRPGPDTSIPPMVGELRKTHETKTHWRVSVAYAGFPEDNANFVQW